MVNPLRIQKISNVDYYGGTVVYQMCRDIRASDNDALLFAQQIARERKAQLIVNYVIWNYKWEGSTRRFYDWVIPSLKEVETELRKHNIPLVITFEEKKLFEQHHYESIPELLGAVVIDQLPLHFMKRWKQIFLEEHPSIALYEVDAHNCIPVWHTSPKQEFAARTIRPKIHALLPSFLEDYEKLLVHHENEDLLKKHIIIDWNDIMTKIKCNEAVTGVGSFIPGTKGAHKILATFLEQKITSYDISRNEINTDGQSNLSPYIAHGNIGRRRIILELIKKINEDKRKMLTISDIFDPIQNGSNEKSGSIAAFVEECIIRAELSDNFCFYNNMYNSTSGFPAWAVETLHKAQSDIREYIYTVEEFEQGKTHDLLWNAAQEQMIQSGKMHGYMRMYWAKKILEWTKSPEDALRIAIYLNDVYELDGRDPNGYVGCAWSIGGVHDRPWFGRPIFGAIRYMAQSGVEKRGKVDDYIEKWSLKKQKLF